MEVALTPRLDLTEYASLSSVKRRRVTVNPENLQGATVSATSTKDIHFSIPASQNSLINSQATYLAFNYQPVAGTASFANGSPSSLIRSLQVTLGSQVIEMTDNYNVFSSIVEDFQANDRASGLESILKGTKPNSFAAATPALAPNAAVTALTGSSTAAEIVTALKTGSAMTLGGTSTAYAKTNKQGEGVASTAPIRVVIPLYSATIGVLCNGTIPAIDSIRVRLTLESGNTALVNAGSEASDYTLSNIALQMDYLDMLPSVMQQMVEESGGVMKIHGTAVSSYTTSQVKTTEGTILIPARFSSVKSILTSFRASPDVSDKAKNSVGGRAFPKMSEYNYKIGGANYPSTPVVCTGAGEVMAEVIRCFHGLHALSLSTNFDRTQFLQEAPTEANQGAYLIGYDYEEEGAGGAGVVGGIDTISSNIFLDFKATANQAEDMLVNSFVSHDLLLDINMSDGTVTANK